jgi:hypothetical protein
VPKYGTHCLRRRFRSQFNSEDDAKYFMGKATRNDTAYYGKTDEQLDELYNESLSKLAIFNENEKTSEELEKQKETIDILTEEQKDINLYNKFLKDRIQQDEERIDYLENFIDGMIKGGLYGAKNPRLAMKLWDKNKQKKTQAIKDTINEFEKFEKSKEEKINREKLIDQLKTTEQGKQIYKELRKNRIL